VKFEARGGRAVCPYDPSSNYTIVYVGKIFLSLYGQSHCGALHSWNSAKLIPAGVCRFLTTQAKFYLT